MAASKLGTALLRLGGGGSWLGRGRCRRGAGRFAGCSTTRPRSGGRRRNSRLSVVGIDNRFRNIQSGRGHDDWTLRPLIGRVKQQTVAICLDILVDYRRHLLQDALGNLIQLRLILILGVLSRALQALLLGLD